MGIYTKETSIYIATIHGRITRKANCAKAIASYTKEMVAYTKIIDNYSKEKVNLSKETDSSSKEIATYSEGIANYGKEKANNNSIFVKKTLSDTCKTVKTFSWNNAFNTFSQSHIICPFTLSCCTFPGVSSLNSLAAGKGK